jgi:hypothetical protein
MIDEKQVEKAFNDFDATLKGAGISAGNAVVPNINACATWHSIRGTVDEVIKGLRAVGTLFSLAKRAADILETLKNLLNALCP